jgi:hypothetical protein
VSGRKVPPCASRGALPDEGRLREAWSSRQTGLRSHDSTPDPSSEPATNGWVNSFLGKLYNRKMVEGRKKEKKI